MPRKPISYCFILSFFLSFNTYAQTPGGVAVTAWYRSDLPGTLFTDAGFTPASDNTTVYQWNEATGTGYHLLQSTASARPVYSNTTALANFNPTVTFDGSNDWMQYTAGTGVNIIDRANGTLFAAGYVNLQKASGFAGFHASMDYPGLHVFTSPYRMLFFTGGPGYQGLSVDTMHAHMYFAAGTGWQNGAGASSSYAAATVTVNGTRTEYTGSQLSNANLSTGARDFRIGADNNWGAFSGQLNEILIFEERLTTDELDQVETYLSIKYGLTFAKGTRDYKNSSGSTVWDATRNSSYRHNIAGIARDDQGELYQKQSWSSNGGTQLLIGVGGLANTNAANGGTLSDGQYLIWGDNGLAKAPVVVTGDFTGITHRFAAIWRVQNTGSVGTVRVAWPKIFSKLVLIQSDDEEIGSGDLVTDMTANEVTVNGVVYNYADVTLEDGSYFTLGAKPAAPGGVTQGLIMWHKSDDGSVAGTKSIWRDVSGNEKDVRQNNNANYQPRLITDASHSADGKTYFFNFNPFYYFDGTNDFFYRMDGSYFPASNSPGTAYGVMFNSAAGGARTPYGWGDDDPNLVRVDNNYYFYRDNGSAINTGSGIALNSRPAHIGGLAWKGSANGVYLNVDGQLFTANTGIGSISSNGSFVIGCEGYDLYGDGTEWHQGGIAEVFAYTEDHQNSSGDEKLRINSYLALKYGITLLNDAGNATSDYLSSASDKVWDAAANSGYNSSVAGIARDDNSALHQKQSQSNRVGQQVLIGTTGLANTNELNGTGLSDGQFLIWGDNGLGKVPSVSVSGVTDVNFRFAAVWKVQNTGSVGTVRVAWPAGLTNLKLLQSSDPTFATVDLATDMSANEIAINGALYNYADVTLADGVYFTFATKLTGPGGVAPDLRVWLRADAGFTPSEWTDFSGNENHYTQAHASRQPFLSDKLYNFNPVVDFGTLTDARFMVLPEGKPYSVDGSNSTLFTISLSKSKSGITDVIGFGNTTTTASLTNANAPVFSKVGTDLVLWPYTSSPGYPKIEVNRLYLDDVSFTVGVSGIKYGKNGQLATVNSTVSVSNARFASGSILGSQPEPRNGYIGEVIAFERDISEDEKKRVRTYVAVKYGITLAHDYISADSTVVWDRTLNAGYNSHIAGIARDDEGSLYQKQSSSVDPGNQVLISTTGLGSSNAANTGELSDQQFLIWGDNGMARSPSVAIAGIDGVNFRLPAIWKVQNTNNVGTVRVAWKNVYANLKLIQSDDHVIDASDIVTDMNGRQSVNGVEYAYADVILEDGQYFTFAAFVQAPGGVVEGLLMWHKADDQVKDPGAKNIWHDVSGNERDVYQENSASYQPILVTDATHEADSRRYFFNHNPFYYFDGSNDFFFNEDISYFSTTNSPGSVYGVMHNSGASGWRTPYCWADDDPCLNRDGNSYTFFRNNGGVITQNLSLNNMPAHIGALHWKGTSNGVYLNFNGRIYANEGTGIGTLHDPTLNFAIGSEGYDLDNDGHEHHQGGIAEVFAYEADHRNSTGDELQRINTYLALKYGITLTNPAGDGAVDYLSSRSDTVYKADDKFRYNIAGIGHDLPSALHQKQSRSVNANSNGQVTIGVGDIAESNAANANTLEDGQFLVWADNNNTTAMTESASTYMTFEYAGINDSRRMNRVWKVQNTGVTAVVKIRFPIASVGTTTLTNNDECAAYSFIYADDSTFTTNVQVVPLNEADTSYEVTHIFPQGVSYFTFGKATPVSPAVAYLPDTRESSSETLYNCGIGSAWTYFHKSDDANLKLLATSDVPTAPLTVTITPEGTEYDDGARLTRLMPRIATIVDDNNGTYAGAKVRVYYDPAEMGATLVPGAKTNGWFKYSGEAEDLISDLYNDGKFDLGKAIPLIPEVTGIEDGVHFVEFHNITSFSSFVYLSSTEPLYAILPVSLTGFSATSQGGKVVLHWTTAGESNSRGFEVLRGSGGQDWKVLGFVPSKASHGQSTSTLSYSFVDEQPLANRNYYRLKQIDMDDKARYSEIRIVNLNSHGAVSIRPNPVQSTLTVHGLEGRNKISVFDLNGKLVYITYAQQGGQVQIDASGWPAGTYLIRAEDSSGKGASFKVIKQ